MYENIGIVIQIVFTLFHLEVVDMIILIADLFFDGLVTFFTCVIIASSY